MQAPLSDAQRLLVTILLADDGEADRSWNHWKRIADLDTVDANSFAVLPLVYRRLRGLRPDDEVVRRLGSVYRQSNYRNKLVGARLEPLLSSLASREIPSILLSGVALSEFYYTPASVRPYQIVQLAVRPEHTGDVGRALEEAGWVRQGSIAFRALRMGACERYRHPIGFDLDLCTRIFFESPDGITNGHFWKESTEVTFRGAPARILEPHAQLTLACVRSLASMGDTDLLSIVDTARIVGTNGGGLDRKRLVSFAQSTSTVAHLRSRLRLLLSLVSTASVEDIVNDLDGVRVSRPEMREFELNSQTGGALGRLPWLWANFVLRGGAAVRGGPKPFAFLDYVRQSFGLESLGGLPQLAYRKLLNRFSSRTDRG